MPNWCHNFLVISGPREQLERFKLQAAGDEQPLLFANIVPEPEGIHEREQTDGKMPDWYTWRCDRWGTKWDANFELPSVAMGGPDAEVSDSSGLIDTVETLEFGFLTAWSPPEQFVATASSLFPELRFKLRYAEPGWEAAGERVFEAGEIAASSDLQVDEVLASEDQWC
jgi:hypothetical protein